MQEAPHLYVLQNNCCLSEEGGGGGITFREFTFGACRRSVGRLAHAVTKGITNIVQNCFVCVLFCFLLYIKKNLRPGKCIRTKCDKPKAYFLAAMQDR